MYLKLLKNDIRRNKTIIITISMFITISAFLVASSSTMMVNLMASMEQLFSSAGQPDFIQYHSGEISPSTFIEIDKWSLEHTDVLDYQISEMLNVPASSVYLNSQTVNQKGSVMESMFTRQNEKFDYLLDLDNNVLELENGEIGIPLFYYQREGLQIGDKVMIKTEDFSKEFIIKSFIRDAQMNPSIVSSKRLLVSDSDYEALSNQFFEVEYQIGYKLKDEEMLKRLIQDYSLSSLPKKGPTIDRNLLKLVNSITDGLVFILIILISIFLNLIAILSLRYIILSTIEEDYREIGVMKAIGFRGKQIKKIYMTKYAIIASVSCLLGYVLSLIFSKVFLSNILLYIGKAKLNILNIVVPIGSITVVFMIILFFCSITMRRYKKVSAVDAISSGVTTEFYNNKNLLPIYKLKKLNVNFIIGIRDVVLRGKIYVLLFAVFIIATFMMIVPVNFYQTINSDGFIAYTGIGSSDLLIDIRQTEDMVDKYDHAMSIIRTDRDIEKYASITTSQYEMITDSGEIELIRVDSGDFDIFPLTYESGMSPKLKNEIAISTLYASQFDKRVGDSLILKHRDKSIYMIITGIYQDITNGGKTTKSAIEPNQEFIISYLINVDTEGSVDEKILELESELPTAKITHVSGYFEETFGNTIDQLRVVSLVSIIMAIIVSSLITALFMRMLLAKDYLQIVIMKSLGFKEFQIRVQYITRALFLLLLSIITGSILANSLGEKIIGAIMSIFGVSNITFLVNPLISYILLPIALIMVVLITTIMSSQYIKETSITRLSGE